MRKRKITLRDKARYAFDRTLYRGTASLVGWLALASATLVLAASLLARLATGGTMPLASIAWQVVFQALVPNPVDANTGPWPFLLTMFLVTLGSLFMVSILIGLLTTGIADRIRSLRKGRSLVVEKGHTVILGWDDHIFTIISEFVTHNASKRKACLVILGNKDKVEMEDAIREKIGPTGRARIICRSGDPISHVDLEIVNLDQARSIVVMGPDDDDPDASVIKTLLAIINNPVRRKNRYNIVAEIRDPTNLEAAQLVGGTEVELVLIGHISARIIAQTCRRSGLSSIYSELLDFQGDAIYFREEPSLLGKTFADALLAYETSSVMGIRPKSGSPRLNPPMDMIIEKGDKIIALSADFETVLPSGRFNIPIRKDLISLHQPRPAAPERILILGWNARAATVIQEIDLYVAMGSETTVVVDSVSLLDQVIELKTELKRQTLRALVSNTTQRKSIDSLQAETYHHVVVLTSSDNLNVHKADARTLITLLHLREIRARSGKSFSIVSEMLDEHSRTLAEVTRADDFIVSGKLASLLLAQISENKELHAVFSDLFSAEGSEIYLKPIQNYVRLGERLDFYTVVDAARSRNEVALGYRIQSRSKDHKNKYGIVLNPHKSKSVTFAEADQLIVLAEAEVDCPTD